MNGLGYAKNISIIEFSYISEYTNWTKENPQYYIHDIQFKTTGSYHSILICVVFQVINPE